MSRYPASPAAAKISVDAKHHHVSIGTVRAQIKTILAKVGVKRQAELTARLNQL
jgi:hypothetical protein